MIYKIHDMVFSDRRIEVHEIVEPLHGKNLSLKKSSTLYNTRG